MAMQKEKRMKNNTHLRQESIKRVLSEIRLRGPVSKRELQAITGFSWGNISSIITLLMNEKYIIVSGKQETYVGRKPEEFDINTNDNYIIGIDFNSEGALVLLCDLKGRVTKEYKTSFTEKHKDSVLNALYALLEKVIEDNKAKNMLHIAIAMQGEVDTEQGISVQIAAIDGWKNIPVCEEIKKRFDIDTTIYHDPDCLLYAEKHHGCLRGKNVENAILLRIDHDIGIAAMLNGKIYMGNKCKTCEIGPTVVPVKGESGWSLLKHIIGEHAVAEAYMKHTGEIRECKEIAVLAENGEAKAKEIFTGSGNALGFALHNTISLMNPETVVVFGEFTRYSHLFLEETKKVLGQLSDKKVPEMAISALNNDSAAVGASIFTADTVIRKLEFEE